MDDTKPTYEELKKKLDKAEQRLASLKNSGAALKRPGFEAFTISGSDSTSSPFSTERDVIEAYIESEENFRNSLEACPLGIRVVTADGELFYANKAILTMFGYKTIEELKAASKEQLYTPESYTGHLDRKAKRIKGEFAPSEYEINIRRPDGAVRTLLVYRREISWGGRQQFLAMYEDITERLEMENAIRYHGYLVENIPDAVMSCDSKGRLISWNKGAEKIYGWRAEEAIGQELMSVLKPVGKTLSHLDFMKILRE